MDFILSLTHFCEMHGPKSVLCTQVSPLECGQCLPPPSPQLASSSSSTSLATQIHAACHQEQLSRPGSLRHADTGVSLPTNFSAASTNVDSAPESPTIERHELFVSDNKLPEQPKLFKSSGLQGDTCASCSLVVPEDITRKLPDGAPGSLRADGKTKNGAPVLRSREIVCLGGAHRSAAEREARPASSQNSSDSSEGGSVRSGDSLFSNCHDHLLTYLTSRNPDDPDDFSALRASVIRTLSRELLPAGMSDGPLCFGDSMSGYTIAYVFRLPDPKARGRRRLYAFVALAGSDASRAFRACPLVWEAFSKMAKSIEMAAVECQEEQKRKEEEEEEEREAGRPRNYTPVSSFLVQRAVDPNGNPRKAGQIAARSLADIVGNDRIFSEIHSYFVSLLHHLGALYGGLPMAERPAMCQTTIREEGLDPRARAQSIHTEILRAKDMDKLRDQDATPRPKSMDAAAPKMTAGNAPAGHCAPITTGQLTPRHVVV